jgi:hypothetical protein
MLETSLRSHSKKEIESSKMVRDIQRRLAFESDHGLKIAFKNGSINNLPITTRDVDNATAYFGKDIGMLKGKTTATPPTLHTSVEVTKYNNVPQTVEMDLFYVDGHMFLGSVSEPLDLTMVNYLSEESATTSLKCPKKIENVRSHMFNQLDAYRNEGFNVSTICYDSESVLKSIATDLIREGYKVKIISAGRHGIPRMDRKIRMIKERCRCILSTLPYEAPSFMIPGVSSSLSVESISYVEDNHLYYRMSHREKHSSGGKLIFNEMCELALANMFKLLM